MVKAGYKTSEFWLTSLVTVYGLVLSSGILPTSWESVTVFVSSVLAKFGYDLTRGSVKKVETQKDILKIVDSIEKKDSLV
jgi:hypothetical protein